MLSHPQQDLWNRIRDFAIDDPSAFVKYSDKLAHSNGWSKDYSARVIEEYKKFLFLCCVLPNGASPSKPIDEAWHLHLTYTHNYWKELCAGILEKEIHHFPSKGGPQENDKHVTWYNDTLASYKELFGSEAPPDIWTKQDHASTKPEKILQTAWSYPIWYKKYLYVLGVPFLIIVVFFNKINPYNLDGPQFLVFYAGLAVATSTWLLLAHAKKTSEIKALVRKNYKGDANVYQLARFIYGRERSLRAAIIDLAARQILEPQRRSRFIFHASHYKYSSLENNPLIMHLLKNVGDGAFVHYNVLSLYYDDAATYHEGLSELHKSVGRKDYQPLIGGIAIEIIGIARIWQGIYNYQPVSYLAIMCMVVVFLTIIMIYYSVGKNIMKDIFLSNFKSGRNETFDSTALASAFVFLGLTSVSGMDGYGRLHNTFSKNRVGYSGDSSGGCGSSGCGSSGCGGGCGGGGCGGCGGS